MPKLSFRGGHPHVNTMIHVNTFLDFSSKSVFLLMFVTLEHQRISLKQVGNYFCQILFLNSFKIKLKRGIIFLCEKLF